jgi:hypothetical protein
VVGVSDETLAGTEHDEPLSEAAPDAPTESDDPDAEAGDTPVRRYVDYVLLGGFLLLGGVAAISLYLSAGQVIADWVAPEFRSLFRTAFNLVVLLVVGVGISWQLRRVR